MSYTSSFSPGANAKAAARFFRKLLKGLEYAPRVLVTDKLASYGAAPADARGGASPIEVSEQSGGEFSPTDPAARTRDETLHLTGHAQRFLSALRGISPHFRPRRHLLHAEEYRSEMANRFSTWNDVTELTTAA
jgi:putative transposase